MFEADEAAKITYQWNMQKNSAHALLLALKAGKQVPLPGRMMYVKISFAVAA